MIAIQQTSYLLAPSKESRTKKLIERIQLYPEMKRLFEFSFFIQSPNAMLGHWEIEFDANLLFPAIYLDFNRTIYLNPFHSEDTNFSYYLFELINISQYAETRKVFKLAQKGLLGKEEFTQSLEQIEFHTAQIHHRIMSRAIKQFGWSKNLDLFEKLSLITFDQYWNQTQKISSHADCYRQLWMEMPKSRPHSEPNRGEVSSPDEKHRHNYRLVKNHSRKF